MTTHAVDVAHLISLNGGQLIGKTRLQKSAYFLEAKGTGFGFDFDYYHFGPYSEELADSTDDACALKLVEVDWKVSQAGTRYAVFCSTHSAPDTALDNQRRKVLDVLKNYSAVEVELAATADFLKQNGFKKDPWAETYRRKAAKVNEVRAERAKLLLQEVASI
jgi:uncharacterized protein